MGKKSEKSEDSGVKKGFEPNFTTRDPTKKEMDAWIKKHITKKNERKTLGSDSKSED
jgi:hypothetical protein